MLCAYMRDPSDALFSVIESRAREWNAPLVAIDDTGPFDLSVLTRFAELCKDREPKIWHGHDYKSNAIGYWLRRRYPMALVTTVHGWVKRTWKTPLYYAIDRATLRRHDHVICVSEDLFESCLSLGVQEQRCTLIHNAIDTDYFIASDEQSRAKTALGLDPEEFVIASVGRLSAEKAFSDLIRAFSTLNHPSRRLRLCIAGEGDEMSNLANLIKDLRLDDRVNLLGFVSDTRQLYEAMDVFALSSLREGLPNVLLESMSMGVPVVSTAIAGIPDLIKDGVSGTLVAPGEPRALGAAIQRFIDEPAFAKDVAVHAREWMVKNYSFSVRMEKIKGIYDRVLDDPIQR
jgi:glycosyltransferase involved in cell wall biosynthesis